MNKITVFLFLTFFSAYSFSQVDTCWSRSYGGSGSEAPGFGSGFFGAPDVKSAVDASDNLWVTCATNSADGDVGSNAGISDVWVIKINPTGDTLFTKVIGGSGNDVPYDIHVTSNDGVVIAGLSSSSDGGFSGNAGAEDGFLMALDANGNLLWNENFGGSQGDFFFDLEPYTNGYYLMGSTGSVDGDINDNQNAGSNEAWICKVNHSGNLVWSRTTSGTTQDLDYLEHFWDGTVINDAQDIIVQGITGDFADFNTDDFLIVRYDSMGAQIWLEEIGSDLRDIATGIEYSSLTNEVIGTGNIMSASGDVTNYAGGNGDYWLFRMDLNGSLVDEVSLGGSGIDYPYSLSTSPSNSLFVAGLTQSTDGTMSTMGYGGWDFWAAEINPYNLDTLQTLRLGGSENDYLHQISFRSDNNLYAVGRSRSFDQYVQSNQGATDVFAACLNVAVTSNVNEIELTDVEVFPNPFRETIHLSGKGLKKLNEYKLMDVTGKTICKGELKDETSIEIPAELSTGCYLLTLKGAFGTLQKRVIKE